MQVVAQVLDTLVSEAPVVVSPGKLLLYVSTRLQGGQRLDDLNKNGKIALLRTTILYLEVGHSLQLGVLGSVEVLLGHHDSLFEQMFVDGHSVLLGHQHP